MDVKLSLKVVKSTRSPDKLSLRTLDGDEATEFFNKKLIREAGFNDGDEVVLVKKSDLIAAEAEHAAVVEAIRSVNSDWPEDMHLGDVLGAHVRLVPR